MYDLQGTTEYNTPISTLTKMGQSAALTAESLTAACLTPFTKCTRRHLTASRWASERLSSECTHAWEETGFLEL